VRSRSPPTSSRALGHRQDPDPAPGLQEGRQRHRRQFLQHLRRRRRGGPADRGRCGRARHHPLARIVGHATHSQEPEWFTTAPIGAIHTLLDKTGWSLDQVDLFEINEAFAVVAMAPMRELGIPHDKLNVNGGACALGHPIGASGARLVVTLVNALRTRGGKRGIATLCIGGGEATAIAIELI
jgi:acetyl-CoA acetyltransferase